MEAKFLKDQILYYSSLINNHKGPPNYDTRKSYFYKPHLQKPKPTLSYFKNSSSPFTYKSTAKRNITTNPNFKINKNPTISGHNPFKIVKSNSTNGLSKTYLNKPTIALNSPVKSFNSPSQIVINKSPKIQSSAKSIKSLSNTSIALKTKYKLIKDRSKPRLQTSTPTSVSTLRRNSTSIGPKINPFKNKFNFVNKVSPILSTFKTYKKPHFGVTKLKWWQYRTDGFSKNNKVLSKTKPIPGKYKFNKNQANFSKNEASKVHGKNNLKLVSIGGLMYRATSTKLSRAQTPKKNPKWMNNSIKTNPKFIYVRGIKYKVSKNGDELKRVPTKWNKYDNNHTLSKTINNSRIDVGRKTYIKDKTGVFKASQAKLALHLANRAVNKSIHRVLNRSKQRLLRKNNQQCKFYIRFGKCHKGKECNYIHDPDKVAICTRFLRGTCKISTCPFSHKLVPEKMPVCSYFLQGRCSSENCAYRHVKVNSSAVVCNNFIKGYCEAGEKCKNLHVLDCQEFRKKGTCAKGKNCPLRHKKAICKRKQLSEGVKETKKAKLVNKIVNLGSAPSFISINSSSSSEVSCIDEKKTSPFKIKPRFLKK